MKTLYILPILFLLSGCATLSRDQCQQGDWFGIGLADGQVGQAMNRLDQHNKACAEYGIGVDSQQYLQGRAQGLNDYCRLDNAFDSGLRGQRYQRVCPPSMDAVFDRYNAAAYEVYELRRDFDSIDSQLASKEYQLTEKDLSNENYHRLRRELRDLDLERDRVQRELRSAEHYLEQLMDEAGVSVR